MYVKKMEDIKREKVDAGEKTSRQVLIGPNEAPNFALRRFEISPGGYMPEHTNSVEHEQFVLAGQAEIGIGNNTYMVKKNDVVYIPANVSHWYKVIGNETFEFLCAVPNKPDIVQIIKK